MLSLCAECVRKAAGSGRAELKEIHVQSRGRFDMPSAPAAAAEGVVCRLCVSRCLILVGGRGYGGVRRNEDGRLKDGTSKEGAVSWYHDALADKPEALALVARTLLVPGYADAQEIGVIAGFMAKQDVNIPYALLGFHGDLLMTDLPSTARKQAEECLAVAKEAGLKQVRLGNV